MKTTGQILEQKRDARGFSIEQVAEATKIRPLYLKALEADDYRKLPSPASAQGFLKNYAEFLDLPSSEVLAVFRRDFDGKKSGDNPSDSLETGFKSKFFWSPRLTTVIGIVVFIVLFAAYLIWQYRSLLSAPYY